MAWCMLWPGSHSCRSQRMTHLGRLSPGSPPRSVAPCRQGRRVVPRAQGRLCCRCRSRKSIERRKRRLVEEEEDTVDRQREARELERRASRAAAERQAMGDTSGVDGGYEGTPGPAGSGVQGSQEVRREVHRPCSTCPDKWSGAARGQVPCPEHVRRPPPCPVVVRQCVADARPVLVACSQW
jgi:hypothetical protein